MLTDELVLEKACRLMWMCGMRMGVGGADMPSLLIHHQCHSCCMCTHYHWVQHHHPHASRAAEMHNPCWISLRIHQVVLPPWTKNGPHELITCPAQAQCTQQPQHDFGCTTAGVHGEFKWIGGCLPNTGWDQCQQSAWCQHLHLQHYHKCLLMGRNQNQEPCLWQRRTLITGSQVHAIAMGVWAQCSMLQLHL